MSQNLNTLMDLERWLTLGAKNRFWYQETHADIQRILPDERIDLVIDLLAATSIRASISSNVKYMFSALLQYKLGLPFTGYLGTVIQKLDLVRAGIELDSLKIRSFARAMKGDERAVVVDVWMCRAFGITVDTRGPSDAEYIHTTNMVQELAQQRGVMPREYQAMLWDGIRQEQSQYRIQVRYRDLLLKYKPWYDNQLQFSTP